MKLKSLLLLVGLLISTTSHAALLGAPFIPEVDRRFDKLETAGTGSGNSLEHLAKVVLDVTGNSNLGTSGSTHGLGVYLPAGALITQSWFYTVTQFTGSGSQLKMTCEDAGNVMAATGITGITAGTITAAASTGSAATMVAAIAAQCQVTADWSAGTGPATAGKGIWFIRYTTIN